MARRHLPMGAESLREQARQMVEVARGSETQAILCTLLLILHQLESLESQLEGLTTRED